MHLAEPAFISDVALRARASLNLSRPLAFAWSLVASVGFAYVTALLAAFERRLGPDYLVPAFATAAVIVGGLALERFGAVNAWRAIARAIALSPLWAAAVFFEFWLPVTSRFDARDVVAIACVTVPSIALLVMGAWHVLARGRPMPHRWRLALAGLALLWPIALFGNPVERVEHGPVVDMVLDVTSWMRPR